MAEPVARNKGGNWSRRAVALGREAVLLVLVVLAVPCVILLLVAPLAIAVRLLLGLVGVE